MGYDNRQSATTYTPTDGDTLRSIAQRETEAGNPLTWQEIARFDWGTDSLDTVDEFLRDELGCYMRGDDNRFVVSADVQVRTPLLIPQAFRRSGLATTTTHTLAVRSQAPPPPQFESCTRVGGINFEFDSDAIRETDSDDFAKVVQKLEEHPDAKAMIFGHTDKVGSDEYNKDLSERRARSVFNHLTNELDVDAGRFMDPKHMGCGEFNPVEETEEANEPNRRVTVFLFNPARLPNLPCVAGDLAPCRQQIAAPLPRHRDSFHCSFYDSIAQNCPEEGGPGPSPATIEILDEDLNVATHVKMGIWDNAFDASNNILNTATEADHFCGADTRRFHFRVNDPEATTDHVDIEWKSLDSTRSDLDSSGSTLTLPEDPPGSKTFVSKGLMLTCDLDDVKEPTNSGLSAPLADVGDRNHGQSNHRTRTGDMDGFVKGEYTPSSGAPQVSVEVPVFDRSPDERKRMPVQVFVLRSTAGGATVVPTAAGSQIWTQDIRVIKETYERLGIFFETNVPAGTAAANQVTVDGDTIVLIDPPAGVANPSNVSFADETTIATAFPRAGSTLRLFYTGGLASGNRGEAWPDVDHAGHVRQGAAFVDPRTSAGMLGPYSPAHELGHVLIDKSVTVSGAHYTAPAAPAGNRLFLNQNLMRGGTSSAEGANQSKRLWDANDGDGSNQHSQIAASPYLRNR